MPAAPAVQAILDRGAARQAWRPTLRRSPPQSTPHTQRPATPRSHRCARPARACHCARPRSRRGRPPPFGWDARGHGRAEFAFGSHRATAVPAIGNWGKLLEGSAPVAPSRGPMLHRCGQSGCWHREPIVGRTGSRSEGPFRCADARPSTHASGLGSCRLPHGRCRIEERHGLCPGDEAAVRERPMH